MYSTFLILHSLLRWVALLLAVVVVVMAWRGFVAGKPFTEGQKKASFFFILALDVMLLLGIALWLMLSPATQQAFQDFGAAMKTRGLRFWAVEHVFLMLAAIVLAHIGHAKSKRAADDKSKHKLAAIFFTIALVLLVAGIPWPFIPEIGRPLLPF